MPRKVIQICVTVDDLNALCDDGSIWYNTIQGWKRLADIPQDDDNVHINTRELAARLAALSKSERMV